MSTTNTSPITDGLELISSIGYAEHGTPHETFRRLRQESPVHRCAPPGFEPFWAITKHADIIESRVGIKAELVISEDDTVDAIRALVKKDLAIKSLILAAAPGWRPGPLVSRLAKGKPVSSRPIAVTVIPGKLTDEQLQEIGGMPG